MLEKYQSKGVRIPKGQKFNGLRVVTTEQVAQLLARVPSKQSKGIFKLYKSFKLDATKIPKAEDFKHLGEDLYNKIATILTNNFGYTDNLDSDIEIVDLTSEIDPPILRLNPLPRLSRVIGTQRILPTPKVIEIPKDNKDNNSDASNGNGDNKDEALPPKKRRTRADTKEERGTVLSSTRKGGAIDNKTIQKLNEFKNYLSTASIKKFYDLLSIRQLKDIVLRSKDTSQFAKNKKKFDTNLTKAQKIKKK